MNRAGKRAAQTLGTIAYWLSWPVNYLYLRGSQRSRVLLVAEGKVLLIKSWHGSGKWSLPGGGINKREQPVESAVRELMEETGIALGTDQLELMAVEPYKDNGLSFTCHYFIGRLHQTIAPSPRLPEVITAEWVSVRELHGLGLAADARAALTRGTIR